jgi:hypothetical protein
MFQGVSRRRHEKRPEKMSQNGNDHGRIILQEQTSIRLPLSRLASVILFFLSYMTDNAQSWDVPAFGTKIAPDTKEAPKEIPNDKLQVPPNETPKSKLPGYSTSQVLENTDVILQYIQEQPEMNMLGARALKFIPDKDRWSVRVHYTGDLLLLPPKCLRVASPDLRQVALDTGIEKTKLYHSAMALIKKNLNLRRNISHFVQQGVKTKGPGALVINLLEADSLIPKFIDKPEALFSPKQIVFLSVAELEQKFGRAFTHGRGELKERFEPGMEWPDLVKTTALFVKNQVFAGWNQAAMAPPGTTDPQTLKRCQDFYETYGVTQQHATAVMKFHFARRCAKEQPPFAPQNPHEFYVMSVMKKLGAYDGMAKIMAQAFGDVGVKNIYPLGDAPLWSNDEAMDGYRNSMGCSIFCFLPVPVAATITNEMNDTVYGWRVIGFDTLTLWLPDMERRMRAAKTEEEKLTVFENDFEEEVFDA